MSDDGYMVGGQIWGMKIINGLEKLAMDGCERNVHTTYTKGGGNDEALDT